MKTIIIDDEERSQICLKESLVESKANVQLLGMASNAQEGYQLIRKTQPDLVFLDVEMPNGSGFDMLKQFHRIDFEVVFVTGFDEHAINAIKFNALDFILKPYAIAEVGKAVDKAKAKIQAKSRQERMENLLYNLQQIKGNKQKIALPNTEGLAFVQVEEIIRLEAEGRYTRFHLRTGKSLLISRNIQEFEKMLGEHDFFRIHRKHIVGKVDLVNYHKGEGGYVVMSDGANCPVSRLKKREFLAWLGC